MSIYGLDWSAYDEFRFHLNGRCSICFTAVGNDNMCPCCWKIVPVCKPENNIHIAADIYHEWQKDKYLKWKWNDVHRRGMDVFKFKSIPIYHKSIYTEPTKKFGLFLSDDQRNLAYTITKVFFQRRREENDRKRKKMYWYRYWIVKHRMILNPNIAETIYTYDEWMSQPRTQLLSYAIEEGLTFRHVRRSGYYPWVMEAYELVNEKNRILQLAKQRIRRENKIKIRQQIKQNLAASKIQELWRVYKIYLKYEV